MLIPFWVDGSREPGNLVYLEGFFWWSYSTSFLSVSCVVSLFLASGGAGVAVGLGGSWQNLGPSLSLPPQGPSEQHQQTGIWLSIQVALSPIALSRMVFEECPDNQWQAGVPF